MNSPAGIGLSTNEDIHLSADGQINQIAGDSINLSTQKNLVAHVQNRISLFAAQNGIKQVAAKGKFEVHAQSNGLDLLAKQGIQIISTEDRIEITSPKEIVFTAQSSQLKLNGSGIFPTTGGKFEVKAGQHLFMGGAKVSVSLPKFNPYYSGYYVIRDKKTQQPLVNYPYELQLQDGRKVIGKTNRKGETLLVNTTTAQEVKLVEQEKKKKTVHQLFAAGSGSINLNLEYFDDE